MLMFSESVYGVAANITAFIHFLYVLFVVIGQIVIVIGIIKHFDFVKNFYFRMLHLIAIGIVAVQEMVGVRCPLTILEDHLNTLAGLHVEEDLTFIGRLLYSVTYYAFPDWAFTLMYVGFGVIVLITMLAFPPRFPPRIINYYE